MCFDSRPGSEISRVFFCFRVTRYPAEKPKQSFTPSSWQEYSEANLDIANKQIKQCLALQAKIDTVLAHVASHLKSQKDLADRAFERRIDEVKAAKLLLEKQLSETIVKIGEMEESIRSVERAIAAKQVSPDSIPAFDRHQLMIKKQSTLVFY